MQNYADILFFVNLVACLYILPFLVSYHCGLD